jgi:hypothetical protein
MRIFIPLPILSASPPAAPTWLHFDIWQLQLLVSVGGRQSQTVIGAGRCKKVAD